MAFLSTMYISPKRFQRVWLPCVLLPLALGPYNIYLLASEPTISFLDAVPGLIFFVLMFFSIGLRIVLLGLFLRGIYFMDDVYNVFRNTSSVFALLGLVAYAVLPSLHHFSVWIKLWIGVHVFYDAIMCVVERWISAPGFQQYMMDRMVVECLRSFAFEDSISSDTEKPSWHLPKWSRLTSIFRRKPTGAIALPLDDDAPLEMGPGTQDSPWIAPTEFTENLTHWSRLSTDWHTCKALWITTDGTQRLNGIAREFSSTDFGSGSCNVALVDVSETYSVFWPLIYGYATTSAEYRKELGLNPPPILIEYFHDFIFRILRIKQDPLDFSTPEKILNDLLVRPVARIYKQFAGSRADSDLENAESPEITGTIVVVHGIRNTDQAEEIYAMINILQEKLENNCQGLGIVVISEPQFLRHIAEDDIAILNSVCTMYVSEIGSILYSGNTPSYPVLHENIFLFVVDCLHRIGGSQAERIWSRVQEISRGAREEDSEDGDESTSIMTIFSKLRTVAKDRKHILECLPEMSAKTRAQIPEKIREDNVKIAGVLQELFNINYKRDLPTVPVENATAVLNITHSILDTGLPENDVVDYPVFLRHAQRLLNLLATHLGILPEELTIANVVLLSDYPIAHGGFANIYHGKYTKSDGHDEEVALKVLKIFENQSEERRHILHRNFFKEALAWHYLKHKNIVPFLGVESTIFPSPFRAMVSPWMPQGSVLKYMTQNSPSSPYAIELLYDVIQGLKYLHSVNIVHGDLCGRNILIDSEGHARLADFGLAAFIESDTTRKTSTRSGSTRWMSPELIVFSPGVQFKRTSQSDVWAFGCVCCEIWSEGVEPFSHFPLEPLLIFAFSEGSGNTLQRKPYQSRPRDKGGVLMSERLWEFVQLCWKEEPSERPTVQILAAVLSEMKRGGTLNPGGDIVPVDLPIPSGSGTVRDSWSSSPALSVNDPDPGPSSAPSKVDKGKQVRFEEDYAVVRFGPLDLESGAEEAFFTIFDALVEIVPKGALAQPRLINAYGLDHLDLHFRSSMEANNFTMTWTVHRLDPFRQCTATVVTD